MKFLQFLIGLIVFALSAKLWAGDEISIHDALYQPLKKGFIVTKRAAANPLAKKFADYMGSPEARRVMVRYGFVLPGETAR
jgi:molybdate transport system substrate-binding protein